MYIGIIPVHIRRNKAISDKTKLLYAEITACMGSDMSCTLTNQDFGEFVGVKPNTVRYHLYELRDLGLIEIEGNNQERRITLPKGIVQVKEEDTKKKAPSVSKKKELTEELVAIWNEHFGMKIRATQGLINMVSTRSNTFSDEEIIKAVTNRIAHVEEDEWYENNQKHKRNIELVLRDDNRLQRHLNEEIKAKEKNVVRTIVFN